MRLLEGLRDDIARREVMEFSVKFPVILREHGDDRLDGFLPTVALAADLYAERVEFGGAGAFTHTQIDPPAGQQVQRRDPFGHAVRLVCGQLDDTMAEPDILRSLTGRAEEDFGCGGMRVFFQKVVFHFPCIVVPKPVCEFDLRQ